MRKSLILGALILATLVSAGPVEPFVQLKAYFEGVSRPQGVTDVIHRPALATILGWREGRCFSAEAKSEPKPYLLIFVANPTPKKVDGGPLFPATPEVPTYQMLVHKLSTEVNYMVTSEIGLRIQEHASHPDRVASLVEYGWLSDYEVLGLHRRQRERIEVRMVGPYLFASYVRDLRLEGEVTHEENFCYFYNKVK